MFLLVGPETRSWYITFLNWTVARRKFRDAKVRGEEPVTRNQYEQMENNFREANFNLNKFSAAYNALSQKERIIAIPGGGNIELSDLIATQMNGYKVTQDLNNKIAILEVELGKEKQKNEILKQKAGQ